MRFLFVLVLVVGCAGGPAGGGSVHSDAGDDDPTGDGAMTADARTTPITCGGMVCRTDQTCDQGVCKFGCIGATVPGDYATIQSAIDALASANADATICLGENTYNEPTIYVRDQGTHQKALKIVGLAMDRSKITTDVYILEGWQTVTLQGLQIAPPSNRTALRSQTQSSVNVIASKLVGGTAIDAYQRHMLTVDGCELVANGGYGISGFANQSGPLTIKVDNSYFHTSSSGYAVRMTTASGYAIDLRFVNNTVVDYDVGLDLSGSITALIANTIITGATTHGMQWLAGANITHRNNALWGNVTNYAGLATDGPAYIKTDCLLDTAGGKPPALGATSACRNVADAAVAPAKDFYGVVRVAPDIGAVEAP